MSTTQSELCLMAVAVEIAASKWVVASSVGAKVRRRVLKERTALSRASALVEEIERARGQFKLGCAARVVVVYEAGQEGWWLRRELRARGLEAEVCDASSLQVPRKGRWAKTDRLDAESLVGALWRYLHGDRRAMGLVREPSEAVEDAREWQRERDRLKQVVRSCTDRIRKKLRTHGVWELSRGWREGLRGGALCDVWERPLKAGVQMALVMELERLEGAEGQLRELESRFEEVAPRAGEQAAHLAQLQGIGPVSARALALLLYWREFRNRREVGACVGLVGVPYDSGGRVRSQGISRGGDPRLRSLLVELGWLWLRHQPESALSRWFRERTRGSGGRHKRVMIVALARRLAVALWRYVSQGVVPAGARLKVGAV